MKFVRNKKSFVIGIFCITVSVYLLAVCILSGNFDRWLYFSLLQATSGIVCVINAISPGFLGEKQFESFEDERDIHIASKCTLIASRIMFYFVVFALFIFWILHKIYENTLFLGVSVSLASCLLLFTIVYLIANIYYEKRG